MSIPTGAAVRHKPTGRLGEVVRLHPDHRLRGTLAVQFRGETAWQRIDLRDLDYIARRMETALAWEVAQ